MMNFQDLFINFIAYDHIDINNDELSSHCKFLIENHGYENNTAFINSEDEVFRPLVNEIEQRLNEIHTHIKIKDEYKLELDRGWCNVNNNENIDQAHTHPLSLFSIVYYVEASEDSGDLEFITPNAGMLNSPLGKASCIKEFDVFNSGRWKVSPQTGKLLIFPGWLTHFVRPNKTQNDRISIAFDTRFIEL
jgi:uncharacterized protein (TIGR02466 family)